MPSTILPTPAAALSPVGMGWLDAAVGAVLAHAARVAGRRCRMVGAVPQPFIGLASTGSGSQELLVAVEPDASGLDALAALAEPGGEVVLVTRDALAGRIISHLLTACPLTLLRTEALPEGGLLVAAIRPLATQAA